MYRYILMEHRMWKVAKHKAGKVSRDHMKGFQFYCKHDMIKLCFRTVTLEVRD